MGTAERQRAGPAAHWLLGAGALALGLFVYLTDRPSGSAPLLALLPRLSPPALHIHFGVLGGWLPSFVHALAFSLFSAALLTPQRRWQYGACGVWFAINAVFELGQHPRLREPLAAALRHCLGPGSVTRALENYVLHGRFDVGDLVAAAFGAALAAALLHGLRVRRVIHHGP